MRESFVDYLKCPNCRSSSFRVIVEQKNNIEIRQGYLECGACQNKFEINKGILGFLANPNPIVKKGQEGWVGFDLQAQALPFRVEDARSYEKQLLALPDGDDSGIFHQDTIFRNIAGAAHAFYDGLSALRLTGKEKLLDLGADICWSTNRFAKLGCQCVALDINHHLPVSDVYIYKNNVYFERIVADMSDLPFVDEYFDVVVTVTSLHHSPDLMKTFAEIARVLKPQGKALLVNEPLRSVFNSQDFGHDCSKRFNLNDRWYTAAEYYSTASKAGLRLAFKPCFLPVSSSDKLWKRIIKSFVNKNPWITEFLDIPFFILLLYPAGTVMLAHKQKRQGC